MRRHKLIISILICFITGVYLYSATGTPSNLIVRTDANGSLVVTGATQVAPITQGVFTSRILRTDSSGNLQVIIGGGPISPTSVSVPASTCAAPALNEQGAVTTGIAFTATPSILECVSGIARGTLTTSSYTLTVPILEADGTASAPSYSFANEATTGMYRSGSGVISWAGAGTRTAFLSGTTFATNSLTLDLINQDVSLSREAAGHLFDRNGTNAQRLSIANTYTSSTNYEAFSVDWQTTANVAYAGTRTAATGTSRALRLTSQQSSGAAGFSTLQIAAGLLPIFRAGFLDTALANVSSATAGTWFSLGEFTSTATSGSVINTAILPTYNQSSGTAANTDFLINRTQTAVGSGIQKLIDLQIGSVVKHYITADGTAKGTQEVFIQATAPTCTAANNCGTGNGTFATGSNDTAGSVTLGTTPASGFVITFNGTWVAAPVCSVWMNKAGMVTGKGVLTSVTTTTTITVVTNGTAPATGDIYAYRCTGIQ